MVSVELSRPSAVTGQAHRSLLFGCCYGKITGADERATAATILVEAALVTEVTERMRTEISAQYSADSVARDTSIGRSADDTTFGKLNSNDGASRQNGLAHILPVCSV